MLRPRMSWGCVPVASEGGRQVGDRSKELVTYLPASVARRVSRKPRSTCRGAPTSTARWSWPTSPASRPSRSGSPGSVTRAPSGSPPIINKFFERMLKTASRYGGDTLTFGGDAILLLFEGAGTRGPCRGGGTRHAEAGRARGRGRRGRREGQDRHVGGRPQRQLPARSCRPARDRGAQHCSLAAGRSPRRWPRRKRTGASGRLAADEEAADSSGADQEDRRVLARRRSSMPRTSARSIPHETALSDQQAACLCAVPAALRGRDPARRAPRIFASHPSTAVSRSCSSTSSA